MLPLKIVAGALLAASPTLRVLLVGRPEVVEPHLNGANRDHVELVPSCSVIILRTRTRLGGEEHAGFVDRGRSPHGRRGPLAGVRVGRQHRGDAGGGSSHRQTRGQHPKTCHRHHLARPQGTGGLSRRRGQRRLQAGASARVRRPWDGLRPHGPGRERTAGGAAEHRRGGGQGQRDGAGRLYRVERFGPQLRGQRRRSRPADRHRPTWWSPTGSPATSPSRCWRVARRPCSSA